MKALICDASNKGWETSRGFDNVDVPTPVLDEKNNPSDADYVIIKVRYAGVCGSDRGIWYRQAFRDQILQSIEVESKLSASGAKNYRIMGHEFFGEVIATGTQVKNIALGDLVTCESHVVCNVCYQCVRGEKHVCINEKILGISTDGGFAEFAKVPSHIVWKTDVSRIRPEVAVVQEPFGNAVHAASKTDLSNKTIAIFGLGPIGLFLTLIARAMGAQKIIGIDPNPRALEMARNLGIDEVILLPEVASGDSMPFAHNPEVISEIMRLTDGMGTDASFEMAGFNNSVNNCLYATRRGGEIILFGIKNGNMIIEDHNRLIVQGYTIHCVIGRQVWDTWKITRRLLEDTSNGIQEKIFNGILEKGASILPIERYTKETCEEMMRAHVKMLIQFS